MKGCDGPLSHGAVTMLDEVFYPGVADDAAVVLFVDGSLPLAQAKTRVEILADANYPPYSWQEGRR